MRFEPPAKLIFEDADGKRETVDNIERLIITNEYTVGGKKLMSINLHVTDSTTLKYAYRIVRVYNEHDAKIKRKYLKKGNTIHSPASSGPSYFEQRIMGLFT